MYDPQFDKQVIKLCRLGATEDQLAEFFEVSRKTIRKWMEKYPGFRVAVRMGKMEADANVADALYHRALGYSHPELKVFANGWEREVTKHYPPDTTAAIFWLKTRQRQNWRETEEREDSTIEERMAAAAYGMDIKEYQQRKREGTLPPAPSIEELEGVITH